MAQATSSAATIDPQVWAALIGAFAGALITFGLTEASSWLRDRREQDRVKASARAALRYEVADNLSLLADFWSRVAVRSEDTIDTWKTVHALLKSPAPNWTDAIWRGLATAVVVAFSDTEIAVIYRLYSTLADVSKTQQRLTEVENADIARKAAAEPIYTGLPNMPTVAGYAYPQFGSTADALIPALDERIALVLSGGNPIPM
jgi:hypothetical protein